MAGLFASPNDVHIAQQNATQSMSRDQMLNYTRGSLFNLGMQGGQATQRGFGGDPRSDAMKRQAAVQGIMSKATLTDPNSVRGTINKLNQEGFSEEAFKLFDLLPKARKPDKVVVDEWFQTESVGDTTKKFLFQRDNFGFISKVGEVTDSATLDTFKGLGQEWGRDVQFDEDSRVTFLGRMAQRPEFKSFVDDTDIEELEQFQGLIAKVANDVKDNHKRHITDQVNNGGLTSSQANATVVPSDDWYLDTAYQRFVKAGGVEANIDRGWDVGGADVKLAPDTNTTDSAAMDTAIANQDNKTKAVSDVAARTGKLVVGDPRSGEFTMTHLNPEQAVSAFTEIENKSNEQIRQQLESEGFSFSQDMFQSHASRWEMMREMPSVTSKFINLTGNKDLYNAERARLLDQLETANNFSQFAKASEILKYIERLGGKKKKRAVHPRELAHQKRRQQSN